MHPRIKVLVCIFIFFREKGGEKFLKKINMKIYFARFVLNQILRNNIFDVNDKLMMQFFSYLLPDTK